jgi:5-methylcytosine-specific restriction enzyme subunit McrC
MSGARNLSVPNSMKSPIPIRNLYYLFCYAWDRFPEGKAIDVGDSDSPELYELLTRVLVKALTKQIRRGLFRGYVEVIDDTNDLRGKIVVSETMRRLLHMHGKANCKFDELDHDILPNQVIKATLKSLNALLVLDRTLREQVRMVSGKLRNISDIRLSPSHFRRLQVARNIHQTLLPDEEGGGNRFVDVLDDAAQMAKVFEHFVRNFYRIEQKEFLSVASENIDWDAVIDDASHKAYLPSMTTDITLRSPGRTIVIDTKFYKETLVSRYDSRKVWSSHLYQLYSYLKNFKPAPGSPPAEGILLYPAIGESLDLHFVLGGHPVRVATVNLNLPWQDIHAQLLGTIRPRERGVAVAI